MKSQFPQIICKDGAKFSVQASQYHYCTPRIDEGPYSKVEVGFPTVEPPASWIQYAEDKDNLTATVFAWIPCELVEQFITEHGGLDISKML